MWTKWNSWRNVFRGDHIVVVQLAVCCNGFTIMILNSPSEILLVFYFHHHYSFLLEIIGKLNKTCSQLGGTTSWCQAVIHHWLKPLGVRQSLILIFLYYLDNMKDSIVAKLASQCEDLYAETLKTFQRENLKNIWDKEWIPMVFTIIIYIFFK